MKRLLTFLLLCLAPLARGEVTLYAILSGTNVVDVMAYEPTNAPTLPAGTTNVACPDYVQPGWRYLGTNWFQSDGSPPPQKKIDIATRIALITDTINDLQAALSNWDTLTAAQQKAVLKRLTQVVVILLKEDRVDISVKDESQ